MSSNPLLSSGFRPSFQRVGPADVRPAVREIIEWARDELADLAAAEGQPTWESTIARLDEVGDRVDRIVTPVEHLMAVAETPELRAAYNEILPEITQFWARVTLDPDLWKRVRGFAESEEGRALGGIRRRHLEKTLLEFRRAGAELDPEGKRRLEEIKVELSRLGQRFAENVLDATAAYELHVREEERVAGIPEVPLGQARARAEERGVEGWIFTLDQPSYEAVVKYAHDRELRRTIHTAYIERCREGKHCNREIIVRILELRQEMASLLGYPDFPDYRLEEQMAKSGARAVEFVRTMEKRTRPYFERDLGLLRERAERTGLGELQPWDVHYLIEGLRRERFEIDDETLRPYFPLHRVLAGAFEIVDRSFGLSIEVREVEEVWHPDVRYYEVRDADGTHLGSFYTDWFPRKEKRQGAWMAALVRGGPTPDGGFEPNLGVICGNFQPPGGGRPALLSHREVETLFHELGHLLHHLVSRVPVRARGGTNVAWDWVEVPSQLMENFTWEREGLDLISGHYETGEPIPEELLERMLAARRFMGGWSQMRQLGFGTIDLALHAEYALDPEGDPLDFVAARLLPLSAGPAFAERHILTVFSHLFAGGYAAGYYSYLWSEVLEADAFTRFREEGILSPATGRAYLDAILTRGDSADPEELFREFMGRDPDPEALIERNLGKLERVTEEVRAG